MYSCYMLNYAVIAGCYNITDNFRHGKESHVLYKRRPIFCKDIVLVRRYYMKDGTMYTDPPLGNRILTGLWVNHTGEFIWIIWPALG